MHRSRDLGLRGVAIALVASVAVLGCADSSSAPSVGQPPTPAGPAAGTPIVVAARVVCRLIADNASAAAAGIRGTDGAPSVVVDGKGYWFFGDTIRAAANGRQDVIPASVATTTDTDASDCIDLTFKTAAGMAQPLFPRADETTAWPDGILPMDDGSIAFYMVKAFRQSPFAWHVGAVGLGRVAPGTTAGAREVETIWDEASGFGSRVAGVRSAIRQADDVIVLIRTDAWANYAARAPIARMGEFAAYTYWDGADWSPQPQDARPLWPVEPSTVPPDNGVQVTYDERAGKWLAIYNGDLGSVKARTAPQPWGPWSEPTTWLDCRPLTGDAYPYCYSAELHRELSRNDGSTLYLTFSSQQPYDVTLVELQLGVGVHEWQDTEGNLRYAAAAPGPQYSDGGVAFYASPNEVPGLAPVYETASGNVYRYSLDQPASGAQPVFHAYAVASGGAVRTKPVYRWAHDGGEVLSSEPRGGYSRGAIAFYVPCLRSLAENTDCPA